MRYYRITVEVYDREPIGDREPGHVIERSTMSKEQMLDWLFGLGMVMWAKRLLIMISMR